MPWLRDSDDYTQRVEWDGVSYEARWHYRAMIEYCSRSRRWDGRLPLEQARRVSDVPDPDRCIADLEAIGYAIVTRNAPVDNSGSNGFVTGNDPVDNPDVTRNVTSHVTSQNASHVTLGTVTLPRIGEHVPPKGMRNNAPDSKLRMQRKRAHDQGEHHLCLPKNCPQASPPTPPGGPAGVTRNTDSVTRNPGTGLNQSSGRTTNPPKLDDASGQSGRVGGPGGGPESDVARNAARHAEPPDDIGDAVQDRRGARVLIQDWPGVDDEIAAFIIRAIRADARRRNIPIHSMPGYLAKMHVNGDLVDYVGAALDHFDGRRTPLAEAAEPEPPPHLRSVPGAASSSDATATQPSLLLHAVPDEHPADDPAIERDEDGIPAVTERENARAVFDRLNAERRAAAEATEARRRHGT